MRVMFNTKYSDLMIRQRHVYIPGSMGTDIWLSARLQLPAVDIRNLREARIALRSSKRDRAEIGRIFFKNSIASRLQS